VPSKLPAGCYWDRSGRGHWYTTYLDANSKQRRKKIAGPDATLSDLHRAMEERDGIYRDSLAWLAEQFEKSPQFAGVSKAMQKDYRYCRMAVCDYPTRKPGVTIGSVPRGDFTPPLVQKLVDGLAIARGPTAAKHCHGYLKRIFNWGIARGYCTDNPCKAIEMPKERKRRRLPDKLVVSRLVAFAQERGELSPHTEGSCPHYIWIVLQVARLCRLRGIEVLTITDAQLLDEGLLCLRTKGSAANVTRWNPDLRTAVEAAQEHRNRLWKGRPTQIDPKKRVLIVNTIGDTIKPYAWQNTWKRFMDMAVREGVIEEAERFGLHDMKRRGVTDTRGTKAEKMEASGHSSLQILKVYDMSVPVVDAAGE